VDAVVCNSAIWQTGVAATVAAVSQVLRPGGRLVFNVGAEMLTDHAGADRSSDPLVELMAAYAASEYGWTRPADSADPGRPGLSESWLRQVLGSAGLGVEQVRVLTYRCSLEEQRAWLSIPIFTKRTFGSLSHEQRMAALGHAYQRLSGSRGTREQVTSAWVAFVAAKRREVS